MLEFARTDLITLPKTTSITEIAKIMREGIVGSVFLTGEDGSIEGLVTDRGIFDLIVEGKNPLDVEPADIMEQLILIDEDTPALDALELMKEKNVLRLGITRCGEMIGIVSKKKLQFEQLRIIKEELGIEE